MCVMLDLPPEILFTSIKELQTKPAIRTLLRLCGTTYRCMYTVHQPLINWPLLSSYFGSWDRFKWLLPL